ncbi:hypothetical protein PoB_006867000 [Plakobranchus ocellatus]|uniref:Uncharacterized protein n=1 Tax=Plakobranchus ocellatus TaxID=259542 RepID=A0AAV4DE07_9GAST|nr:hypothetical protein PoB_006867000 [Plakobranchus ocellatus]
MSLASFRLSESKVISLLTPSDIAMRDGDVSHLNPHLPQPISASSKPTLATSFRRENNSREDKPQQKANIRLQEAFLTKQ